MLLPFSSSGRFGILVIFLVFSAAGTLYPEKTPESVPLFLMDTVLDFGKIRHGEYAQGVLRGKNISGRTLSVLKTQSSCGCTIVTPALKTIAPGNELELGLSFDSNQKNGAFEKHIRIYFRDETDSLNLSVKGFIEPQPAAHMPKGDSRLFSQACAACHVNQGINQHDFKLYQADCAPCHGIFRAGSGSAPPLPADKHLAFQEVLEKGKGKMPAFSKDSGGPLDGAQISYLLRFLEKPISQVDIFRPRGEADRGLALYRQFCASCHGQSRLGPIGPPLSAALMKSLQKEGLEKLLREGNTLNMPSFLIEKGGLLTPQDIAALAKFLAPD
ncbi:MAG: c-type cytochrome [Planctomycetes bacterium]|nr:c-type cytochrome [Planctomycetota bacterium]